VTTILNTTTKDESQRPITLKDSNPPVIVIGGSANALSVVRSLGRMGVPSYVLSNATAPVRYSRFAKNISVAGREKKQAWTKFLISDDSKKLEGAVLIPACDDALEILIEHQQTLKEKFRLDLFHSEAQQKMLSKVETYTAAKSAGVPTPKYWLVQSRPEIESIRTELVFPLLLKPAISHHFVARFGVKYWTINSWDELNTAWNQLDGALQIMLVEKIPGNDSNLCSYYTYIDEQGSHLFQFTKRIVRRFPPEMGVACRHVTDHVPSLHEPARKLFAEVGLRGLANVEFKLDPRDGVLKLIECNARVTAANVLLDRCGLDLTKFVYYRICDRPTPVMHQSEKPMYLWNPTDDLRAFLLLSQRGELTLIEWLRSIAHTNVILPCFQWSDPMPSLMGNVLRLKRFMKLSG